MRPCHQTKILLLSALAFATWACKTPGRLSESSVANLAILGAKCTPNIALNLRSEPSTDGQILRQMQPGESVAITEPSAGEMGGYAWVGVDANGLSGYVAAQFLTCGENVVTEEDDNTYISSFPPPNLSGATHQLPILSLFGNDEQIRRQIIEATGAELEAEQEVDAGMEFYENGVRAYGPADVKIRLSGSASKNNPQKSIRIHFDQKDHRPRPQRFLKDLEFKFDGARRLKNLVARNAGNDHYYARTRDLINQEIARRFLPDVDTLQSRPVVTYINGQYYGVQYLGEISNDDYLENRYGTKELTTLKYKGNPHDDSAYSGKKGFDHKGEFLRFIDELNSKPNHEIESFLGQHVDLQQMFDYYILETFVGNTDWPENNFRIYKILGQKWRFSLFDTDVSLDIEQAVNPGQGSKVGENNLRWANRGEINHQSPGRIFVKAMESPNLKAQFIQRYRDKLPALGQAANVVDQIAQIVGHGPETALHFNTKYHVHYIPAGQGLSYWQSHLQRIKAFLNNRPAQIQSHLNDF